MDAEYYEELVQLRKWKAEAIEVLNGWDKVADELIDHIKLGEQKHVAVLREVKLMMETLAAIYEGGS
jgi:hypothetical protein